MARDRRIAFAASDAPVAQTARAALIQRLATRRWTRRT